MLEFFFIIIKSVFTLIIILGLIYLSYKFSNEKISRYTENKYIKILERTQISKDAYILLIKIGEKGYVVSVTNNNVEKLDELTNDEIINIENNKRKEKEAVDEKFNSILIKIKNCNKYKK